MRNRRESMSIGGKEWACLSAQSPLGPVMLARRLPAVTRRAPRASEDATKGVIRRFEPSSQPGSIMMRVRVRRSL